MTAEKLLDVRLRRVVVLRPVSIGFEAGTDAAQRKGDFSGLLALGARYQIYDPYSIAPASGVFSAGNRYRTTLSRPIG